MFFFQHFKTKNLKKASFWNKWGAFLIILGTIFSALSNSLAHGALKHIPSTQLIFLKTSFAFFLCSPLFYRHKKAIVNSSQKRWHMTKSFVGALGNLLWVEALKWIPLSDATALSLTSAFLTTFGAYLFFKEQMNRLTFFSLLFGLVGALLVIQPSFLVSNHLVIIYPLGSAFFFSISSLVTKKVSISDPMIVSLAYLLGGMAIFTAPFALLQNGITLSLELYSYIFMQSIFYLIIQWSLIEAYTHAHAGFLAPFKFFRFPLSILIGYFWFNEPTSFYTLLGGILIIMGCFLIQYNQHDPSFFFKRMQKQ